MATEQYGEIVIAPRVLEKIIAIATAKVDGVPKVAVAIQKAVKTAVYNMADVTLDDVNIHVVGIVTEKAAKPDLKDLFNEDFLND